MKIILTAAALLAVAGIAVPAAAQTEGEALNLPMRAARGAFEVSADVGYTQGFGALGDGRSMSDVAGAGLALGIGLGCRATPIFSLAATLQLQGFDPSSALHPGTAVRGAAPGLEATFHLAPHERADPWLSLGGGYRMLWEVPSDTTPATFTHGFELGRVAIGLDVRPSDGVAIAPMLGAGVDLFRWQTTKDVTNARLSSGAGTAFLFAGVRGRFDIAGRRELPAERIGTSATGAR